MSSLGVQLWPTRSPEFADNYTLESVSVTTTRDAHGTTNVVVWEQVTVSYH